MSLALYPKMKFKCIKTAILEDPEGKFICVAFTEGSDYDRIYPEIWPTFETGAELALMNNRNEEHFMSYTFLHKHFEKLKQ